MHLKEKKNKYKKIRIKSWFKLWDLKYIFKIKDKNHIKEFYKKNML